MAASEIFSTAPGTYLMMLELDRRSSIAIGALGRRRFPAGAYFYAGSARGPGGLRARLAHHCRGPERPRWHIDYLRLRAPVVRVWTLSSDRRLECEWACRLARLARTTPAGPALLGRSDSDLAAPHDHTVARVGLRGGGPDCRCPTHLLYAAAGDAGLAGSIDERLSPAVSRGVRWA